MSANVSTQRTQNYILPPGDNMYSVNFSISAVQGAKQTINFGQAAYEAMNGIPIGFVMQSMIIDARQLTVGADVLIIDQSGVVRQDFPVQPGDYRAVNVLAYGNGQLGVNFSNGETGVLNLVAQNFPTIPQCNISPQSSPSPVVPQAAASKQKSFSVVTLTTAPYNLPAYAYTASIAIFVTATAAGVITINIAGQSLKIAIGVATLNVVIPLFSGDIPANLGGTADYSSTATITGDISLITT